MKKILFLLFCILTANVAVSKEIVIKHNNASKNVKYDSDNIYQLDKISTLDILSALEMLGVGINKIDIPKTDKERYLGIVLDEYSNGKSIKSDTTWVGRNTYVYWERGDTLIYKDYIDEMSIFTHDRKQDTTIMVTIKTYAMNYGMPIKYKPNSKGCFYNIRAFKHSEFKYNEKMPMIAIASSWYDKKHKVDRFCGASLLSMKEADTKELLEMSPNYYIISYILK